MAQRIRAPPSSTIRFNGFTENEREEIPMKIINLKDLYPAYYTKDMYYEVDEEIAELLDTLRKQAHAQEEQQRYNQVTFSYQEGRTEFIMRKRQKSIYRQLESKELCTALFAALQTLSPKQRDRLNQFFWLGMSQSEISKREGVNKSTVSKSIDRALTRLRKIIVNFL